MQRRSFGTSIGRFYRKHIEPGDDVKYLVYVKTKRHQILGNLTLGPVNTLVLGNLLEVFNRLVHKVADIVDFSENLSVCVAFNELLQLAVNHANAFNITCVAVDLLKLSHESVALFIVPG